MTVFMDIWISLTLACNSAFMFMDWYERKIDYNRSRAVYEYIDKIQDIINDAKWVALDDIRDILEFMREENEYHNPTLDEVEARLDGVRERED